MPVSKPSDREKRPGRFEALVALMPPQAIRDDLHHESTVEMIDRLMAIEKLTTGQSCYLETLVQLVQAYEGSQHGIDISGISGLDSLEHLKKLTARFEVSPGVFIDWAPFDGRSWGRQSA